MLFLWWLQEVFRVTMASMGNVRHMYCKWGTQWVQAPPPLWVGYTPSSRYKAWNCTRSVPVTHRWQSKDSDTSILSVTLSHVRVLYLLRNTFVILVFWGIFCFSQRTHEILLGAAILCYPNVPPHSAVLSAFKVKRSPQTQKEISYKWEI